MAPDNLRRQTQQSGNRALRGQDGAAAPAPAEGSRRCNHAFVTERKTTTTTTTTTAAAGKTRHWEEEVCLDGGLGQSATSSDFP